MTNDNDPNYLVNHHRGFENENSWYIDSTSSENDWRAIANASKRNVSWGMEITVDGGELTDDSEDLLDNPFEIDCNEENAFECGIEVGFPEGQILPHVCGDAELCGDLSAKFHLGEPFPETGLSTLDSILDSLSSHSSYGAFSDFKTDDENDEWQPEKIDKFDLFEGHEEIDLDVSCEGCGEMMQSNIFSPQNVCSKCRYQYVNDDDDDDLIPEVEIEYCAHCGKDTIHKDINFESVCTECSTCHSTIKEI